MTVLLLESSWRHLVTHPSSGMLFVLMLLLQQMEEWKQCATLTEITMHQIYVSLTLAGLLGQSVTSLVGSACQYNPTDTAFVNNVADF
ncbi:hypothetical protein J6590_049281 [Homalodisca vitripennis]|nr:hypothetical protein J6590_049281 [Homalodisca vitripennis]